MGFLGAKIERICEPIEIERASEKRMDGHSPICRMCRYIYYRHFGLETSQNQSKTSVWSPHTDVFAFGAASFHGMRLSRFGSVRDPQFPAQHHERTSTIAEMV